jgi:hypothetical protein
MKAHSCGSRWLVHSSAAAIIAVAPRASYAGYAAQAARLFDEALAELDAGNWAAACPLFQQSNGEDPSVGALLNIASCSERAAQLTEAKAAYEEAIRRIDSLAFERRASARSAAEAGLAAVEARLRQLAIKNGTSVPPATGSPNARPNAGVPTQRTESESSLVIPGFVTGGAGLLFTGVGAALLGVASTKASDIRELCGEQPPLCSGSSSDSARATELAGDGRALEIAGGVFVGLGAAALVASAVLFIVDAESERLPALQVVPVATASGGGLWIAGSF